MRGNFSAKAVFLSVAVMIYIMNVNAAPLENAVTNHPVKEAFADDYLEVLQYMTKEAVKKHPVQAVAYGFFKVLQHLIMIPFTWIYDLFV